MPMFRTGAGSPFAVGTGPITLTTADLNGDGVADLVGVSPGSSLIRSWLGLGAGSFGSRMDSVRRCG